MDTEKYRSAWLKASLALNVILALAIAAACVWKFTDVRYVMQEVAGGYSFKSNNWYEPLVYQATELSEVEESDVCFAGDSLTEYGLWAEFFPDLIVINRGIGSDVSAGLLARVDSITATRPSKVFLMIGTNDVSRAIPEDETVANVEEALQKICDELPGSTVYLQSVLPRTEKYASKIESLNKRYAQLVDELHAQGLNVAWIDLYPLYCEGDGTPKDELYDGGYHLSGEGYRVWKEEIEELVLG